MIEGAKFCTFAWPILDNRTLDTHSSFRTTLSSIPSMLSRSTLHEVLAAVGGLLSFIGILSSEAEPSTESSLGSETPIIGAIRWDAWYGEGVVTKAVEKTLGQPKYHHRLPWFARPLGQDQVQINGDTAEVMAREVKILGASPEALLRTTLA